MDLEAHPVPGAVTERLAVARRADHRPGGRIDVMTPVSAGPDGLEPGELRREHDVVHAAQLAADLAGRVRARDVAAVSVDAGAGVDDDELVPRDDPVAGDRVRQGAAFAGRDDRRERLVLGARLAQRAADRPGDLDLVLPTMPPATTASSAASTTRPAVRRISISCASLTSRRRLSRAPTLRRRPPWTRRSVRWSL